MYIICDMMIIFHILSFVISSDVFFCRSQTSPVFHHGEGIDLAGRGHRQVLFFDTLWVYLEENRCHVYFSNNVNE